MTKETHFAPWPLHHHVFLAKGHEKSERKTWMVIWLCGAMMLAEIIGGWLFGSIALIADGLHMSTHAGALLLAAVAYTYARKHATDERFTFGTGKLGDLAGFTSAIILGMIALLIGYESINRFFAPVPIHFSEAIPIACLGLVVNIISAWLLSSGEHGHHHHGHSHDHHDHEHHHEHAHNHAGHEHVDESAHQDNNMRAAIIHVIADATVSVLVIVGLFLARAFGWLWIDPLVGIAGALVIASWSYSLIRDTACILLDMNPDKHMADKLRQIIETEGDELADLHLWRLGPGHLGAIISVVTSQNRETAFYRAKLADFCSLAHLTIEIHPKAKS